MTLKGNQCVNASRSGNEATEGRSVNGPLRDNRTEMRETIHKNVGHTYLEKKWDTLQLVTEEQGGWPCSGSGPW